MLDEQSLLTQLDKKRIEIENAIQAEQEKLRKIELAKSEIQGGKGELHYNISVKPIPAYQVLSLRKVVPTYYSEGNLWKELSIFTDEQKIEITCNTFSIYHDTEFRETDVDIELCAPVKKMGKAKDPFCFRLTEQVPYMACTMVYGDFVNIKGAYPAPFAKRRCCGFERMAGRQLRLSLLGQTSRKKRLKSRIAFSKARETYEKFSLGCCPQTGS